LSTDDQAGVPWWNSLTESGRRQGEREKQVAPTKKLVTMRLSANAVEHFKAGGTGWQTRINETLQRAVKRPASRTARREGVIR
jgi:uncharacterized protein (DUF4415 family)